MTKRFAAMFLCLLAAVAVGACQTIAEKRKIDYRATRTLPPLDIPPDLVTPEGMKGAADASQEPATYSGFLSEKSALERASGTSGEVLPQYPDMHIERDSQMRWLVVKLPPEQLWPKLRAFVLDHGLVIEKENPQIGLIETDWQENRAKVGTGMQKVLAKALGTLYATGTRDKYRIRIERDRTPGYTDVYITQFGMQEVVTSDPGLPDVTDRHWEPRPNDPGLEAEMLHLLMVSLGAQEEQARTAVAAAPSPPARARLARQAGSVSLSLPEDFERAWRRVGIALDRSGFTVEDRDRSKGIYYMRYIDPDAVQKKKGFFSRLFSKKPKEPAEEYQLVVKGDDKATQVAVLDKDGRPDQSKTADRILTLLYEQLK
jgi:outer membrane protein assembly factor BamC